MILSHVIAALGAITRSIQYGKKSLRLGLCYAGFATPWNPIEAWKAGEAAFLSCAYDVVTDWQQFNRKARFAFERILNELSEPELQQLALSLYDKDSNKQLSEHGLERGAIALRFILKMMKCETQRELKWGDLTDLGELLQIVDDIFDYEDDIAAGEQNCLTTTDREIYLRRFLDQLSYDKCRQLFGSQPSVLVFAIQQARKKARTLIRRSNN
jgi:hypothetical protein